MPSLIELRSLLAVIEHGSFTEAADKLGYSVSAVSLHVRRLEQVLGVTLLERTGGGHQPTDSGQRVCAAAEVMLTEHAAMIAGVSRLRRKKRLPEHGGAAAQRSFR